MARTAQKMRVLNHLQQGRPLTSDSARELYGITSFPKRISDLRKDGYEISQRRVECRNRYGEPTHYNEYWMEAHDGEV